jgi:glutaredoxin
MNKVRLYGFEGCPYCEELKGLFEENEIDFTYVDIELVENVNEGEKIMKMSKSDSVPIVLVKKVLLAPEVSFKSIPEALELTKKFLSEEK